MSNRKKQFEENIVRIVKITKTSQQPSDRFTEQLIDKAIAELPGQNAAGRQKRSLTMKTLRFFTKIAAVFLVVGLIGFLAMPTLKKCKKAGTSIYPTSQQFAKLERPSSPLEKENGRCNNPALGLNLCYSKVDCFDVNLPMAHGGTTPPNGQAYDAMFFKNYGVNPFVDTEDDRFSTFATDVDTGSFTLCRQYLLDGHLPPNEAVRVEEFVNYFDYRYPAPKDSVFAVYADAMPWQFDTARQNTYLMRIGLKGMEVSEKDRKPAVLTFVIDVSGSMNRQDRLGLVKQSLTLLVNRLRQEDKIGIAVYGSQGRIVMDHRGLRNKSEILEAIESLRSEGSTNAEEGIRMGYAMAERAFVPGYINRVILCSDGVANVGQTGPDEIFKTIKEKADKGITLSALGFGMGNYNDVLMEQLGDKGNGYYAYIDTIEEAQKLFGDNLTGALQVIARDVKIQVEFDPQVVRSYRLIGYENRDVADKDFRNDKVDGGEIGAGHATTALYELKLWPKTSGAAATVYVRYKDPDSFEATEFKCRFQTDQICSDPGQADTSFLLAARVVEFSEILRDSYWARQADLEDTYKKMKQLAAAVPEDSQIAELKELISNAIPLLKDRSDHNAEEEKPLSDSPLTPLPIEME